MNTSTSTSKKIQRWIAMDKALGEPFVGLCVEDFAKHWRVSKKTVYRDLEAFRKIGQLTISEVNTQDLHKSYHWVYDGGVEWLFLCNWPGRRKFDAMQQENKKLKTELKGLRAKRCN